MAKARKSENALTRYSMKKEILLIGFVLMMMISYQLYAQEGNSKKYFVGSTFGMLGNLDTGKKILSSFNSILDIELILKMLFS